MAERTFIVEKQYAYLGEEPREELIDRWRADVAADGLTFDMDAVPQIRLVMQKPDRTSVWGVKGEAWPRPSDG